jgi:hypothetical protein
LNTCYSERCAIKTFGQTLLDSNTSQVYNQNRDCCIRTPVRCTLVVSLAVRLGSEFASEKRWQPSGVKPESFSHGQGVKDLFLQAQDCIARSSGIFGRFDSIVVFENVGADKREPISHTECEEALRRKSLLRSSRCLCTENTGLIVDHCRAICNGKYSVIDAICAATV